MAGRIYFFTDNKPARDTNYKGKKRARLAYHADLWTEMFDLIEEKGIEEINV